MLAGGPVWLPKCWAFKVGKKHRMVWQTWFTFRRWKVVRVF